MPDGTLLIETSRLSVIIPLGFPARLSQDGRIHVCVYRDIFGKHQPRCLFLPGIVHERNADPDGA